MNSDEFAARLKELRQRRREITSSRRLNRPARKALTGAERTYIFGKTNGRCHICGGEIDRQWQADHVFAQSAGGRHRVDNYLPAHAICNNYRWHYGPEELQWILKLGVFARTEIENQTTVGEVVGKAFVRKENARSLRRK